MLEREQSSSLARSKAYFSDEPAQNRRDNDLPARMPDWEIDNELQAAIEYKIASSGVGGAETVLDLLNAALRRLMR